MLCRRLSCVLLALAVGFGFGHALAQMAPDPRPPSPGSWGAVVAPTPVPGPARTASPPGTATPATPDGHAGAIASNAATAVDGRRTRFVLDVSREFAFKVYTLDQPYRVIVDAADLEFRMPANLDRRGRGLVAAFRYGLLAPGQSRIVIDVTGPVAPPQAAIRPGRTPGSKQFVLDLLATDQASFKRMPMPSVPPPPAVAVATPPPAPAAPPQRRGPPIIMIDPGHGGVDPGAVATGDAALLEKDVVLAVAGALGRRLAATRRYTVLMTRSTDVYVPLSQRVKLSVQSHADLFISIHADSLSTPGFAQNVRGATVYILSETASDERARRLAEKENAADLLAGFDVAQDDANDQVRSILLDLLQRESTNFSIDIRGLLVTHLRKEVKLARQPSRGAAFKVLRQAHAPAVLVELGYMSHAEDAQLLRSSEWQGKVAISIAAAVEQFFARHGVAGK